MKINKNKNLIEQVMIEIQPTIMHRTTYWTTFWPQRLHMMWKSVGLAQRVAICVTYNFWMRNWWAYLGPLEWPAWAAFVLFGHVVLSIGLITVIWLGDWWIHFLYGDRVPLVFGRLPFEYIFQAMDLGVLFIFWIQGLRAAWRELGRQR